MNETENTDWDHWFTRVEQEEAQQYFELTFKAYFYEVALTYYNIVVDLSWTTCYLATEFALTHQGVRINFGGIRPIEEAFELMRKAENLVTNPNAEENPFGYLKGMCPEFSTAIEMIISFWSWYGQSNIRQMYNFCKHKGKPMYTEIQELSGPSFMGFFKKTAMEIVCNWCLTQAICGFNVVWKSQLKNFCILITRNYFLTFPICLLR